MGAFPTRNLLDRSVSFSIRSSALVSLVVHLFLSLPMRFLVKKSNTANIALTYLWSRRVCFASQVLLGDMGAGKTSLVLRFVKGQFYEFEVLSLNEGTIKFDIWNTVGQERYHSLAPMYYHSAAAAVVVYDITSMDSFVRGKKWVRELQRQGKLHLY